jgi:hypothetical protein
MPENMEKIEKLVMDLKLDKRFKILEDEKLVGCICSEDNAFVYQTELESENLKIIYKWETFFGGMYQDWITVTEKRNHLDIYYRSIDGLRNYINKNA